jgi:hypothetical protein
VFGYARVSLKQSKLGYSKRPIYRTLLVLLATGLTGDFGLIGLRGRTAFWRTARLGCGLRFGPRLVAQAQASLGTDPRGCAKLSSKNSYTLIL